MIACSDAGPAGASASTTGDATSTSTSTSTGEPVTTGAPLTTGSTGDSGGLTTGDPTTTTTTTSSTDGDDTGPLLECPAVAPPSQVKIVDLEQVYEASGLIASRTQPGVFWVHNDSGDEPRFFAIDADGALLGEFELGGAIAIDWEDMYFGDIGDNPELRPFVTVYRVREPDAAAGSATLSAVEAIELVYPDEPHNAETLMVDPQTGDLVIVAKGDPTRIFRLPGPVAAGGPYMLEEIAPIQFPATVATGGDISPTGDFIAVRTYAQAFLWLRPSGTTIADAFASEPCPLNLAIETQGETLTVAHDRSGYYTLSEGDAVPLWWYAFE